MAKLLLILFVVGIAASCYSMAPRGATSSEVLTVDCPTKIFADQSCFPARRGKTATRAPAIVR